MRGSGGENVKREWKHDELADDLAAHLRTENRMVWANMQLGPVHSPRPDVYTLIRSYSSPCPTAYECKISRSDFRADVTTGKWQAYLDYAGAVIFAVPDGLITKAEVPEICGLIVRKENFWRMAKKATHQPRVIAQDAMLKLIIDGVNREGPKIRERAWRGNRGSTEFMRRFGAEAARYVSDAASVKQTLEYVDYQRQQIIAKATAEAKEIRDRAEREAPALWAELLQVLGLESSASKWEVEVELRSLRTARDGGEYATALRAILNQLGRITANHEHLRAAVEAR